MAKNSYDEFIYDALPHKQGSIRILETLADLHGLRPVDIRGCRVLEIGTATGKTLISQAEEFPETEFVGIDLSKIQIEEGRNTIANLGLRNVKLHCEDIMNIGPDWGKFDYIIAHGVYSWVPPLIQDKILDLCRDRLSDHGVAMISYNTYPGWHHLESIRNLMCFHSRTAQTLENGTEEVGQAREILSEMAEMKTGISSLSGITFQLMNRQMKNMSGYYIFHEYLEPENHPCYFIDFYRRLKERGLEHVSDFDWNFRDRLELCDDFRRFMQKVEPGPISEQYLDYIAGRTFRASLVCHASVPEKIERRRDMVERYFMSLADNVEIVQGEGGGWMLRNGTADTVNIRSTPFGNATVSYLIRNQSSFFTLSKIWKELLAKATRNVVSTYNPDELKSNLETLVRRGMLKIYLHPFEIPGSVSRHPRVSGFVRNLAKRNQTSVPNAGFEVVNLNPVLSHLLQKLDGRHSIADLVDDVEEEIRKGRLTLNRDDKPISAGNREGITAVVQEAIDQLHKLYIAVS